MIEGDRTASFRIKDLVGLYGGFAGGETGTAERDWDSNLSILSGEIYEQKSFWSLHVCYVADGATVLLDGLTITKGNANTDSIYSIAYRCRTRRHIRSGNRSFKIEIYVQSKIRIQYYVYT